MDPDYRRGGHAWVPTPSRAAPWSHPCLHEGGGLLGFVYTHGIHRLSVLARQAQPFD